MNLLSMFELPFRTGLIGKMNEDLNILNLIVESLIYSLVLGMIITISQIFNARIWLDCYPEKIQDKVPQKSKNERLAKLLLGIPFMTIMAGYPIVSTIILRQNQDLEFDFLSSFINLFLITITFNIFDLLILDWFIFCLITPKYLILKGTEGMSEYKDYIFHLKASMKGFIFSAVYSVVLALLLLI